MAGISMTALESPSSRAQQLARQTLVSQGTFLAYLQVAAEHLGYSASFTLFPDGTYNEADLKTSMSQMPVAKVTLAKDSSATTADYASLYLSDTNRAPYTSAPLTTTQTGALTACVSALRGVETRDSPGNKMSRSCAMPRARC